MQLADIIKAIETANEATKIGAAAVADVPNRRQYIADEKAKTAEDAQPMLVAQGYRIAAVRVGKPDAAGRRPVFNTLAIPMTLPERIKAYHDEQARREAAKLLPKVPLTPEEERVKEIKAKMAKQRTKLKAAMEAVEAAKASTQERKSA